DARCMAETGTRDVVNPGMTPHQNDSKRRAEPTSTRVAEKTRPLRTPPDTTVPLIHRGVAVAGLGLRGYGSTPMSVETDIQDRLKDAMRARDARTADCIRMIKTKHMERRTAAG